MLANSSLFWYRLIVLAELVLAESLFVFRMKRRSFFALRLVFVLTASFLATWFFPLPTYNAMYTSFMFFTIFVITLLLQKLIFAESWITLVFCSVAGYTLQHTAYQAFNLLSVALGLSEDGVNLYGGGEGVEGVSALSMSLYFVCYIFIYWHAFILFARRIRKNETIVIKNVSLFLLVFLLILGDIIINAVIVYESYNDYNKVYITMSGISSLVICVLALFLQFSLLSNHNLEGELDKAYHLLREGRKQYDGAKTNIDLINLKCHDLKHQIRAISRSKSLSEDAIKEIENAISIYDCAVKTGNDVLDTILTEKSLICGSHSIGMTCVIDGRALSFMDELDLYTLFGNIFDNAIEAVMKLETEKRAISLTSNLSGNMLSVVVRNFCDVSKVIFDGELPVTTNADKEYHGFGMKSIKRIIEKYDGNLSVLVKDDVFTLNMLFILQL